MLAWSISCISTSPPVTTSITQHLSLDPYSSIPISSVSTASDMLMLTQNVNLPLGMFLIVIFTDFQSSHCQILWISRTRKWYATMSTNRNLTEDPRIFSAADVCGYATQ